MTKSGNLKGKGEDRIRKDIRKRFEDMFSGEGEPISHLSISQVEALQNRLVDLEARITQKPADTLQDIVQRPLGDKLVTKFIPSGSKIPQRASPGYLSRIAQFWGKLTRAHPGIKDVGEREQAQLSAGVSLGFAVLTFIGFVGSILANQEFVMTSGFLAIITLVVLSTFFINRTTRYKFGSALLVVSLFASGYTLAFVNTGRTSSSLFTIIPIAMVLGSLLIPLWGLAALTGFNFVLIFLLPRFIPSYVNASSDAGIYLSLGTLLIITVAFRNSVERSRLAELASANMELQESRISLEKRVEERTHDLHLASEVGRTVTEKVENLQEMLTESVKLIQERFDLYHTQVYLTDPSCKKLILRAGTGDIGRELLERNHQLKLDASSLNGRAASEKQPVVVSDTREHPNFLPNPLLPNTHSEMVVPLVLGAQVLGVLDMQSENPGALNDFNLPAFQALAGQMAIAIQNAILFQETTQARTDVETQFRHMTQQGWQEFLNSIERSERISYRYDNNQKVTREELHDSPSPSQTDLNVPLTIAGAEIGKIQTNLQEHNWTDQELQILKGTAAQLSQHLENLRLLARAESYRDRAEQVVRSLTREGWSEIQNRPEGSPGYLYNLNEVQPLHEKSNGKPGLAINHPLVVRDEPIGELAADADTKSSQAAEIISAVAGQLSTHIETLRLAEELQKRASELEELDRLKTSFLANMSHELRTPLNSILGFSEVLLEELDGPLTDTMRNDLQLIQKNGTHLLHLINDVLDIAKIEAGRMNLSPEQFNVHAVFEDVINITSPQANDKGISLIVDEDSDRQIELVADRTRISQVLLNVVNNALKFTDQGSVQLHAHREGENALISIRDTGEGIPADKLESIFQEFTQVDASTTRKVGGTGLGLPISRRLIKIHGGRMWAESNGTGAGQGSIFYVELPLESRIIELTEIRERQS